MINTISIADFSQVFASKQPLTIIDVRTPAEFAQVSLRGARSIPLDRFDPGIVVATRNNNDPIYVICQSGGRSAKACEQLIEQGVEGVYSVEGGMSACEKADLPVNRGASRVISLERQVRIAAGSLVFMGSASLGS